MLSEIKKQNVKNMFDLLKNAAENFCDKTFIKWQEEEEILEKSFLETFKDSEKIARYIASFEKILGHRVHAALIGSASYEYVCSMFGVFGGNGVAIPIDNQISRENLIKNLSKADVDVVFFDFKYRSFATYVKKQITSRKIKFICLQDVDYENNFYSIINSDLGKAALPEIDPLKEALIIFTSGTTGVQKGVMLSHLNQLSAIFSFDMPSHPIPQSDEILLSILPIHHIYALNGNFLMPLKYGSTVCLCLDLKKLQNSIQVFNPTQIFMVPMIAKMLVNCFFMTIKQNPSLPKDQIKNMIFGKNLFWLFIGGSSLPDSLEKSLIETGISIAQGYGLTEWSPPALQSDFDRQDKIKSVGKPTENCQLRIQDGEIQVKSPSVMMGYYKEPELTKQAFTQDGFFKTGDLGYIDDDKHIVIHKVQCPHAEKLKANHGNRILAAKWEMSRMSLFPVSIHVKGFDKLGLLHEMTQVISQLHGVNIRKLEVECDDGIFECTVQMFVHDTKEVDEIIEGLRAIQDVKEASRI